MGDAGGELAERSKLLGLNQAVLRSAQLVEGLRELARAFAQFVEQPGVLDGDDGLIGKVLVTSSICLSVNGFTSWR